VNQTLKNTVKAVFLAFMSLSVTACAYQWGYKQKSLPGGYTEVAVPMFKNKTDLVGIEAKFTNVLIHEFSRSKVSKLVSKQSAPVFIEGEIVSLEFVHDAQLDASKKEENPDNNALPANTVLTSVYRAIVNVNVKLIRAADQRVLWTGGFKNERVYIAPQVKLAGANTVNPLYKHSAEVEVVESLAEDMMVEAHDRMIESF
jgi:hypothetical protein